MSTYIDMSIGEFPFDEFNDDLCYFYNFVDCVAIDDKYVYSTHDDGQGVLHICSPNANIEWGNQDLLFSFKIGKFQCLGSLRNNNQFIAISSPVSNLSVSKILEVYRELVGHLRNVFATNTKVSKVRSSRSVMNDGRFDR